MKITALGNADRLYNGNTVITWTTAGEIQVVSPDNEVLWQLNLGVGNGIGYAQRFERF